MLTARAAVSACMPLTTARLSTYMLQSCCHSSLVNLGALAERTVIQPAFHRGSAFTCYTAIYVTALLVRLSAQQRDASVWQRPPNLRRSYDRGMLLLEHGAGNMHLPGSEAALSSC